MSEDLKQEAEASDWESFVNKHQNLDPTEQLIHAIAENNLDEATRLLEGEKVSANFSYGEDKKTPLMFARSAEMVELLIAHGADIEAQDKFTLRPIHHAVLSNAPEVVTALRTAGANLEIPPDWAYWGEDYSPLGIACIKDYVSLEALQALIAPGANRADVNGRSGGNVEVPLLIATKQGAVEKMKTLVKAGADTEIAWRTLAQERHPDAKWAKAFLEAGINLDESHIAPIAANIAKFNQGLERYTDEINQLKEIKQLIEEELLSEKAQKIMDPILDKLGFPKPLVTLTQQYMRFMPPPSHAPQAAVEQDAPQRPAAAAQNVQTQPEQEPASPTPPTSKWSCCIS